MVIWSDCARADLRRIFEYIEHDSPHYARKVVQEITAKPDILIEYPGIGRMVLELGDENVRELLIYSWRIIYELNEKDIIILTIVHQRKNLKPEDMGD